MITRIESGTDSPVLSVLICHLTERANKLQNLMASLEYQVKMSGKAEILINNEPKPTPTGAKRNQLIDAARGEYVAHVDDDDLVSDFYVLKILQAAETHPDCIGITGLVRQCGKLDWQFRHSITVTNWCKDTNLRQYFRSPNHLNPIKTDIVKKVMFRPNLTWGEDRDFSERIKGLLKNEIYIEDEIYFYMVGEQ